MNGKIVAASMIAIGLILSACDASKQESKEPTQEKSQASIF